MEDLEKLLIETDQRCKSNTHRLDRLEELAEAIRAQSENIARMVTELTHTNRELALLTSRVGALERRPGALWDRLVSALLGALAASLAAAALGALLP